MNKIVLTGATGFVGSNLVKYLLDKNIEIGIIIRKNSNLVNLEDVKNKINIFVYNENLEELINFFNEFKPDAVCHLASNFIAEHNPNQVESLIHDNILFGTQLLEAMKVANVLQLINTGTSWQHHENENYNPVCLYAATKQAFEAIIEYYVRAEGFKVITLKLFDTYGETDTRPKLINLLNKFADEEIELKMSPGEQTLNLVHIEDVCNAFYSAVQVILHQKSFIGHVRYAIDHDEIFSLKEVINQFEEVSGKEIKVNWGGREYRKREVMEVWSTGQRLPNWKAKISLKEGLKKLK